MRMIRHRLDGWVDPERAFRELFADSTRSFWLDGGMNATSGMSYLGVGSSVATASVENGTVTLEPQGTVQPATILGFLRAQPAAPASGMDRGSPIGWVGWLGYELRAQTTGIPATRVPRHPDAAFLRVDRLLAFDHEARTVELVAVDGWDEIASPIGEAGWRGELGQWKEAMLVGLMAAANDLPPAPSVIGSAVEAAPAAGVAAVWRDSDQRYLDNIAACQDAIHQGEAYQLCLTTEVTVDVRPDPLATWLALRKASPTHHGGFLRIGGISLLSTSPEQFLRVGVDGTVESKPIKGTRPRGRTPADDERLQVELLSSDKERAENLMIVDLMRNDLGRVCEVGSVSVPALLAVESYAQVHQLVSTVRGTLAAGRHPVDAVEACFPAGSMTGAPKLRAMEILDGLEKRPRGLYSGAFGYFGLDGSIDLAMIIRSIVLDDDGATIGAGGGITADSVPAEELAEVKLKAAALLAVLGASTTAPPCNRRTVTV
jgi:para-aminobenzoate synthetase component 1